MRTVDLDSVKKDIPFNVIDKIFPNGIAGYRSSYAFFRPWLVLREIYNQIKWAYQRVFRGWDDRVLWSVDHYLAENIPVWLREFKKYKMGIPVSLIKESDYDEKFNISEETEKRLSKEYDEILDMIICGFETYNKIDFDNDKSNEIAFKKGFDLLREYFGTLWT